MTVVTKMKESTKTSHFGLYKHTANGDRFRFNCRMGCYSLRCVIGVFVIVFGILTVVCVSYDLTKESSFKEENKSTFRNNSRTNRSKHNSKEASLREDDGVNGGPTNNMRATKRQDVDILSLYSSSSENLNADEFQHHLNPDMMSFPKDYEPKYSAEQEFMRQVMLPTPVPEAYTEDGYIMADDIPVTMHPSPGPFKYVMQGVKPTEFTLSQPRNRRRKKAGSGSQTTPAFFAAQGQQHSPQNIQEIINYLQTNGNGPTVKNTAVAEDANIPKFTDHSKFASPNANRIYKNVKNTPQKTQKPRKKPLKMKPPKLEGYIATRLSNDDPFFEYKPPNPSDINLLAINNFRFATPLYMYKMKTKERSKEKTKQKPEIKPEKKQPNMQKLHQMQQMKQLQQLQKYQQMQAQQALLQQQQQQQMAKNPVNVILDLYPGYGQENEQYAQDDYQDYHNQMHAAKQRQPQLSESGLQYSNNPNQMVLHLNMHAKNIHEAGGP